MNVFEQIAIPPTAEHNLLLNIIQIIAFMIYYPFIGMITGGLILSKYFNLKARLTNNEMYGRFADDITRKLIFSRAASYGLGFLPVFSIAIVYSQFLYSSSFAFVSNFTLSVILYFISFVYVNKYKASAKVVSMISSYKAALGNDIKPPENSGQFESTSLQAKKSNLSLAFYGMLLSAFLFVGGITLSDDMNEWAGFTSTFMTFINLKVWINFIFFLVITFAVTGSAIIFFFFNWEGGIKFTEEAYHKFVRKFSTGFTMLFLALFPLFLITGIVMQSKDTYSSSVFIFLGLGIFALLLASNFLYAVLKNSDTKYGTAIFYLVIAAVSFTVIKNQVAFSNSIRPHLAVINHQAEEIIQAKFPKKEALAQISGEDIYNGRCSACHKFDVKLIGPPYQETVPKYNGDVKKLAQFIYNPVKMNPDYPPMPNQGLKMPEAEAVAKYIIDRVNQKK